MACGRSWLQSATRSPAGGAARGPPRRAARAAAALVDAAQQGLLDTAAALVLTTTCDQMRYAAAAWIRRERSPVFLMHVPRHLANAAVARQLYGEELRRLGSFLVGIAAASRPRGSAVCQDAGVRAHDQARWRPEPSPPPPRSAHLRSASLHRRSRCRPSSAWHLPSRGQPSVGARRWRGAGTHRRFAHLSPSDSAPRRQRLHSFGLNRRAHVSC